MTRHLAVTLAGLAAASTIATGLGAAAQAVAATDSVGSGGLVLTPGSALFDVTLETGVPELRELTITNTSTADLDVQLSVVLSDGAPTDHRMDHLQLHATSEYSDCDPTVLDGAETLTFSEAHRVDQESVAAGTSRTVCVGVVLPADTPPLAAATTIVDFRFHALDAGTGPGGTELPFTGTDALRLVPTAVFAILTGGFLAWLARRRLGESTGGATSPRSTTTEPTP